MASYFVRGGTAGTDAGTSWANAAESIAGLMTAQAIAGGDIIYVHPTHNLTAGAGITWTLPETGTGTVRVLCVDGGDAAFSNPAAMGTTVGTLTTGASESTSGNFAFTLNASNTDNNGLYVYGIQIKTGAAGNSASADINVAVNTGRYEFENCTFWCDSTNTGATIVIGGASRIFSKFVGCTFKFGAASNPAVTVGLGVYEFINCSFSGTSVPAAFAWGGTRNTELHFSGCDLSNCTAVITVATSSAGTAIFNNCTISTPTTGTHLGVNGVRAEFHACAAVGASANILAYYYQDAFGTVQDDPNVYVTTGPAQGTNDSGTATSYSLKMTPSALALPYQPLYTPWIYTKVAATGSKAISMKAADTEAAVLKDQELWLEVEYMGGAAPANSPQSALEGTFPLSGVFHDVTAAGSNLTDTGEAWTGIAETGTYTLSKTVTLDEQGYIRCRIGLGKQTTNPVYVDCRVSVA